MWLTHLNNQLYPITQLSPDYHPIRSSLECPTNPVHNDALDPDPDEREALPQRARLRAGKAFTANILALIDGKPITDPFCDPSGPKTFEYKKLLLLKLKENFGICDNPYSTASSSTAQAVAAPPPTEAVASAAQG